MKKNKMRSGVTMFALALLFLIGCKSDPSDPLIGGEEDPDYRVGVGPVWGETLLPADSVDWTFRYDFTVPPVPSGDWHPERMTVYTYGQLDFDRYGSDGGTHSISPYKFNQIVPQVMIGNSYSGDSAYHPTGQTFYHWVIQAQYFWMHEDGTNYVMTGNIVHVEPGDSLTTVISYRAITGAMHISISGPNGTSSIISNQPFPNQDTLFASWKDFFRKAGEVADSVTTDAVLNVETHMMNPATVCSMLPFYVNYVSIPGLAWQKGNYRIWKDGNYSCTDTLQNKLAILNF